MIVMTHAHSYVHDILCNVLFNKNFFECAGQKHVSFSGWFQPQFVFDDLIEND